MARPQTNIDEVMREELRDYIANPDRYRRVKEGEAVTYVCYKGDEIVAIDENPISVCRQLGITRDTLRKAYSQRTAKGSGFVVERVFNFGEE